METLQNTQIDLVDSLDPIVMSILREYEPRSAQDLVRDMLKNMIIPPRVVESFSVYQRGAEQIKL